MLSPSGKRRGSWVGKQVDTTQEERYDYTDSEFDLTVERQSSQSPLKFNQYMNTLVGRNKLLADAEQFDKARGIAIFKNSDNEVAAISSQEGSAIGAKVPAESPILREQDLNKNLDGNGNVRMNDGEVTSAEHAKPKKATPFNDATAQVSATPFVSNPSGTTIEDRMLVQSTPISKPKSFSGNNAKTGEAQPKDLLREKLQGSRKLSATDNEPQSDTKAAELKNGLNKVKEELTNLNAIQSHKDEEIKLLKASLKAKEDKIVQIESENNKLSCQLEELQLNSTRTVTQHEAAVTKLKKQIKENEEKHIQQEEKWNNENNKLKSDLQITKASQAGLVKDAEAVKKSREQVLLDKEKLKTELNSLNAELQKKDLSLKKLEETLEAVETDKEALSKLVLEKDSAIEEMNAKLQAHEKLKSDIKLLSDKLSDKQVKHEKFVNFISHFTLFGIKLGEQLVKANNNHKQSKPSCEHWLKTQSVVGFKTTNDEKNLESLKNLVDNELKPSLEKKTQEINHLQTEIQEQNSKISDCLDKLGDVQQSREELITLRDKLTSEIASLKSQLCSYEISTKENAFKDLTEQNLKLLDKLSETNDKLATTSLELKNESEMLQKEKEHKMHMKETLSQLEASLTKLRKSFERIRGNANEKTTLDTLSKVHTHINKKTYESLELETIDNLNLVECQNTIKNIVALFEIPYSKLSTKLPLVNIMLRYEKPMCLHFANRVHNLLFHQEIDSKCFTKKALDNYWTHRNAKTIQHPLEQCLDDLYKTVSERLLI